MKTRCFFDSSRKQGRVIKMDNSEHAGMSRQVLGDHYQKEFV